MDFDIKTATLLIKPYDENVDETDSFIASILLLDEITSVEQKLIMLKFVNTRITGKAKYAITDRHNF